MPYDYTIDREHGLVHIRRWGDVTEAEILDSYAAVGADPAFLPGFAVLTDLRDMADVDLSGEKLRELGGLIPFGRSGKRAFVVARDFHYGLLRVFGAHAEIAGQDVAVFRGMVEADRWLDLPQSPA